MDPNNPRPPYYENPDPRLLELFNEFLQTRSNIIPQNPLPPQNLYARQNPSPTQISYPPQNINSFQQIYSNPPPPPFRQNINISPLSQNFSSQENNYPPFSSQTPPNFRNTSQSNFQIEELDDDNNEQASSGSVHFTAEEDEALISSFMRVSEDSIVGTNQKRDALWAKVESLYEEARLANPHNLRQKNVNSLSSRMRRICKAVMAWGDCFEEATRKASSGMCEDDIIKMAHKLHNGNIDI